MLRNSVVAGVFAAAMLVFVPSRVMAQEDTDSFFVDHFTAADQLYTFVNPCSFAFTTGTRPASCSPFDLNSYACANIYVYSGEDIVACGSCFVSPNGSREAYLHANLISHPVTGITPGTGVVKILPTQIPTTAFCDPTVVSPNGNFLAVFRDRPPGGPEIQFDGVLLSAAEAAKLVFDCTAVIDVLSGFTNVSCGATDPKIKVHDFEGKHRPR